MTEDLEGWRNDLYLGLWMENENEVGWSGRTEE